MKYKLVKTYPGSPKLGEIIDKTLHFPEDYPEFWQPIVKKDYEILSFINLDNHIIYDEYRGIYRNGTSTRPIHHCLKFYKIHSIKRLSDSEIFTIGDIVKCEDCKGKITSLEIYDNDIYLNGIDNKMPFGYTLCNTLDCFEIPQKVKQPLFTTEDGVDIFKGDEYYQAMIDFNTFDEYNDLWTIIKQINAKGNYPSDCYKRFSTKEKAEEYILMNKPCLSINDINILKNIVFANWDKTLKDLVKSKI